MNSVFSFKVSNGVIECIRYTDINPIKVRDNRILSNKNGIVKGLIVASRPSMAVLLVHSLTYNKS